MHIDTLIDKNEVLVNGTKINRNDWNQLNIAVINTQAATQTISRRIVFLDDLLKRNLVVKLDQDVLFQPGSFSLSPEVVSNIGKLFGSSS